ncbi:hypothetical protein GIB67_024223 [Kingdonia uniflora]|uniref:Major facilitator superfamily (MFS) profile domain-containing protein n=1 Tax=Kingdonia uniflora TaxID=39325 RepID=A0A7J7LZU8_9MAGN|nr:hypothetical protein GIB67_024223 [Kingdonia uniflora]
MALSCNEVSSTQAGLELEFMVNSVLSDRDIYDKHSPQISTLNSFTSSLYIVSLVACFIATMITRRLGRKISMLLGGFLFLVGAVLNGVAVNVDMLYVGRILLGIGVRFANQAKATLKRIRGTDDVDKEYNDLVLASKASKLVTSPWIKIRERKYKPHVIMAILIPALQQYIDINVVMFYAPVLFKTPGFGNNTSLASPVITEGVNVAPTFVAVSLVDKKDRRFLLIEDTLQMFAFYYSKVIFNVTFILEKC